MGITSVHAVLHACTKCGSYSIVEICSVLDLNERSDLASLAKEDRLNLAICQNCGFEEPIDAPLLVLNKIDKPHFIFYSAKLNPEYAETFLAEGIDNVQRELGDQWDETWRKSVMPLPAEMIACYFREGNQAVLDRWHTVYEETRALLEQLETLQRPEDLSRRIEILQKTLTLIWCETVPQLWVALQVDLARCWTRYKDRDGRINYENAIDHFRQAMRLFDKRRSANDWALLCYELAEAYWFRELGDRNENLEYAITYLENALSLITKENSLGLWGGCNLNLAMVYAVKTSGDEKENNEREIAHLNNALILFTRERSPEHWADIQSKLGIAYRHRLTGNPSENMEKSIYYYMRALEVFSQEVSPEDWARTVYNLGIAYWNRLEGSRSENIEQAILLSSNAADMYKSLKLFSQLGGVCNNLGAYFLQREVGEEEQNRRQALAHYQNGLDAFAQVPDWNQWAEIHGNMGHVWRQVQSDSRLSCLEQAIEHFTRQYEVYSIARPDPQWADVNLDLAISYSEYLNFAKDTGEIVEKIIFYCNQAKDAFSRRDQQEWGRLYHLLGAAFLKREEGDHAENVRRSVNYLQEALSAMDRKTDRIEYLSILTDLFSLKQIEGENSGVNFHDIEDIDHLEHLIESLPPDENINEQAGLYSNLGSTYASLPGEAADNIEKAISFLEKGYALNRQLSNTRNTYSLCRALAEVYERRTLGNPAENQEKVIAYDELALKSFPHDMDLGQYASLLSHIGLCYVDRVYGEKKKNAEKAIAYLEEILSLKDPNLPPQTFWGAHYNLGVFYNVYSIHDTQSLDHEAAIAHYEQALQLVNAKDRSSDWAKTVFNLASSYMKRIDGVKSDNIEKGIKLYYQIIETLPNGSEGVSLVDVYKNLSLGYFERREGNPVDNTKQSLDQLHKALSLLSPTESKDEWLNMHLMIGKTLVNSAKNIIGNASRAVDHFHQLIPLISREDHPQLWLEAHINLALALSTAENVVQPEKVEEAIRNLEMLRPLCNRQEDPENWALLTNTLGYAYFMRRGDFFAEDIERAISAFKETLEYYQPENNLVGWMNSLNNLAVAYRNRHSGDLGENIETAIEYYELILKHCNRDIFTDEWAMVHNNLGAAYGERLRGNRAENIDIAIDHFKKLLEVRTRDMLPLGWAKVHDSLGGVYGKKISGDRAENIEKSIEHHQLALEELTIELTPDDWAMTQSNLGVSYMDRIRGDKAENFKKALFHLQESLRVRKRETHFLRWAITQANIASVYYHADQSSMENLRLAQYHIEQALLVTNMESFPDRARVNYGLLGKINSLLGEWASAFDAYANAIHSGDLILRASFHPESAEQETRNNAELYNDIQTACTKLRDDPQYAKAGLYYAEHGKMRIFLDQISQGDLPRPTEAPSELLSQEGALISQLRQVEFQITNPSITLEFPDGDMRNMASQRKNLKNQLDALWDHLVKNYPAAREYVSLRRANSPSWENIVRIVEEMGSNGLFIEFFVQSEAILAYVIKKGWPAPKMITIPLSQDELHYRYFLPYFEEFINPRVGRAPRFAWLSMGDILFGQIREYMEESSVIYLIPHGILHLFPLHALKVNDRHLIEDFPVMYAPSLGVLERIARGKKNAEGLFQVLCLGFTAKDDEKTLFNSEAEEIAAYFGQTPFLDDDASSVNMLQNIGAARLVHLSCHGSFNRGDPYESCIYLADGELSAREWIGLRTNAELVTLSACETGINQVSRGDEVYGLARALLYSGAKSALLTLWSVNAISTKEWMVNFYQNLWDRSGESLMSKAEAFQKTTLDIKQKYEDPFYWAPFILVGQG